MPLFHHMNISHEALLMCGIMWLRGTPTPGSWPGVGDGNYSDMGVGEMCFDYAEEKKGFWEVTSQRRPKIQCKSMCILKIYLLFEKYQWRWYKVQEKVWRFWRAPQNLQVQNAWTTSESGEFGVPPKISRFGIHELYLNLENLGCWG